MFFTGNFWKFLLISIIGHIAIAIFTYILMGLMAIGGLSANTPESYFSNIFILLFVGLGILLFFQIFIYRRKSLTIAQKLIVSLAPFILGVFIIFNITFISSLLINNNNRNQVENVIKNIVFSENFKLEETSKTLPNGLVVRQAIVVPFELKKKSSLSVISTAHAIGVKGLTFYIESTKSDPYPECSMGNDLFDEIRDSTGAVYDLDNYNYWDKDSLPVGKYEAVKYINISQTTEAVCYTKVLNEIRTKKIITIYASDIFTEGAVPLEIVAEPKLISN